MPLPVFLMRALALAAVLLCCPLASCYYFRSDLQKVLNPPKTPTPPPPHVPVFRLEGVVQGDRRALAAKPATLRGPWLPAAWAVGAPLKDLAYRDLSQLAGQPLGEEMRLVFRVRGVELVRLEAAFADGRFRSAAIPLAQVKAEAEALEVQLFRQSRPDAPLASYVLPWEKPADGEKLVQELYLRQDKTVLARAWREVEGQAGLGGGAGSVAGPVDGLVVTVDTDAASLGVAGRAAAGVRRLSGPDGLHLFDVDGDGVWGEEDDDAVRPAPFTGAAWSAPTARVVDPELSGVPRSEALRQFGTGLNGIARSVQDAVQALDLTMEPALLVAGGPGALLRVMARPRPGVGLAVGATVDLSITGTQAASGGKTVVLDRVARMGGAYAEVALLAPTRPGTVVVTARVAGRQDQVLAASLEVPVVDPARDLSITDLALDREAALSGQSGLVATVRVRNDGGGALTSVRAGLVATLAGTPVGGHLRIAADPDNPLEVPRGRTALFRYNLELGPDAPRGAWTLEAWAVGRRGSAPVPGDWALVRGASKTAALAVKAPARLKLSAIKSLPVLAPGEGARVLEVELANPGGADAQLSAASCTFLETRISATRDDTQTSVPGLGTVVLRFKLSAATDAPLGTHAWTLVVNAMDALDGRALALEPAAFPLNLTVQAKPPVLGAAWTVRSDGSAAIPAKVVIFGASEAARTLQVSGVQFYGLSAAWLTGPGGTRLNLEGLQVTDASNLSARVPATAAVGLYTLHVESPSGSSPAGPVVQVLAAPRLDGLSQEAAMQGRDTVLSLTGQDFAGVTQVKLSGGTQPVAAQVRAVLPGRLVVNVPDTLALGAYEVRLVSAAGETPTGQSLWVRAAPRVTGLSPAAVPAGQATRVTLQGQGFAGPVGEVQLSDGTVLTNPQKVDEQTLQATVPATVKPGTYEVQVSMPWVGRSAADGAVPVPVLVVYRGAATVRVMDLSPSTGFEGEAQTLTITGENFMRATAVALVDRSGTAPRRETLPLFPGGTDLQLSATVPASLLNGEYEVEVTTPLSTGTGTGPSTSVAGLRYRRFAGLLPSTDECVPAAGPTDQATPGVVVTGQNFVAGQTEAQLVAEAQLVGGTTPVDLSVTEVQGASAIKVTVPQGIPAGRYVVRVTVAGNGQGVDNRAVFVVNAAGAAAVDALEPPVKREAGAVTPVTVQVAGRGFTGATSARWIRLADGSPADGKEFGAADGVSFAVADDTHASATAPAAMNGFPGDYDLVITRPGNVVNAASAVRLRVPGAPRVSGPSVTRVSSGVVTALTLTGADFYDVQRVELLDAATSAVAATLTGPAQVTAEGNTLTGLSVPATAPAGENLAGEYHLSVVTPFGQNSTSGRTLTILGSPVIADTGVSPLGFDRELGGWIAIAGENFQTGLSVILRMGSTEQPLLDKDVSVPNPRRVEARVPAGLDVGEYQVVFRAGPAEVVATQRVYVDAKPEVTRLEPATVALGMATAVEVTGERFQVRDADGLLKDASTELYWVGLDDPARVIAAESVSLVSATRMRATLPAHLPAGRYAARVTNAWGSSTGSSAGSSFTNGAVRVNGAPAILSAAVPEAAVLRGDVDLAYTVADPDGDPVFLDVQYRIGTADWGLVGRSATAKAGTATFGIAAPAGPGAAHHFVWDSSEDARQTVRDLYLRLRAHGGVQGDWKELGPLALDNNALPRLAWVTHPNDVKGPVDLRLRVADPENDAVTVTVQLDDGRGSWQNARPTTGTNPFIVQALPDGAEARFEWAADLDLPADERRGNVRLRWLLHDHALHEPVVVEGPAFAVQIGAPARTVAIHPATLPADPAGGTLEAWVTNPWSGVLAELGEHKLERTSSGLLRLAGLETVVPAGAAGTREHVCLVWEGSRVRLYTDGVLRKAGSVALGAAGEFSKLTLGPVSVTEAAVWSWPFSDGGVAVGEPAAAGSEVRQAAAQIVPVAAPDGFLPRLTDPTPAPDLALDPGAEDLSAQADGVRKVFELRHAVLLHPLTGEAADETAVSVVVDGRLAKIASLQPGGAGGPTQATVTLDGPAPLVGAVIRVAYAYRGTLGERAQARR